MSLYLSRLCLKPLHAGALRLAADPYTLHRRLLATVPCVPRPKPPTGDQPRTADLLFRVDTTDQGPVVLIQTAQEPDWAALNLKDPHLLRRPPETRPYAPQLRAGQALSFRLLCQPSIRKSGQFGLKANGKRKPGPRRACATDEQRLAWLKRKADEYGFVVESVGLTLLEWRNTKPAQGPGGQASETCDQARQRAFVGGPRLKAVRFDGSLVVVDPDRLLSAMRTGIGPRKAFGLGLLSIAPAA